MGPFGRNDYDRDFGQRDFGPRDRGNRDRWGYNAGPWRESQPMRGNMGYDRGFRGDFGGYDRGFRGDSHMREPFPTRPSHSSMPMQRRGSGYDHGYFGIDYDRDMRAGGRGFRRSRYDTNFGDFRNSYLTGWF